jgi:hypothetical protein
MGSLSISQPRELSIQPEDAPIETEVVNTGEHKYVFFKTTFRLGSAIPAKNS